MMRVLSSRLTVLVLFLLCLVRIVAAEPIAGKSSRAHIEDQVFDTVTVNRVQGKNALDAVVHNWVVSVASDSVDSATTKVITAAAHSALVGDEIVFTSGALSGLSFNVSAVDTNTITLAQPAPSAPVAAVTFKILRFRHPEMNTDGSVTVSSADGGSGSVIPVSNSTSLKGGANAIVGYSFVVADTAEAASTTTVLNATAHSARLGDMIRFTAGTAANIGAWAEVTSVATNTIIEGKGATYYGIGSAIARIVELILQDERSLLTVCTPMPDVAGVKDVTVSLPNLVGGEGIIQTFFPNLNYSETAALHASAQVVHTVIDQLNQQSA